MGVAPENLHAIYVAPELSVVEPGVIWDAINDASRIEHLKEEFRNQLSEDRHRELHFAAIIGDPGYEITKHAKDIGADLIVMSSHGRRGITRLLIGSVAERVIRLAECPVMVLKQKNEETD